jgi:nicotinamidase-related amidase
MSPAPSKPPSGSRAPRLEASPTVLILIDFVNPLTFRGANRLAPRAVAAARRTAALKRRLAPRGVQAIYANDNFGAWRSDFSRLVAACESADGPSRRLVELLRLSETDITVLKPRHSAFFGTPLAVLLAQLRARRLVLTGVAADICVLFTANDAFVRGFELWVPADCIAAETAARKRAALAHMAGVLKADIRPTRSTRRRERT